MSLFQKRLGFDPFWQTLPLRQNDWILEIPMNVHS